MLTIQPTFKDEVSTQPNGPVQGLPPPPTYALSDILLIEQICQRHEQALGLLYDRYSRLLYTIALRITGDGSSAEEVIQDVFTAVWQTAGGFRIEGNVKIWLIGITRHRAIDTTRVRNFRIHQDGVPLDEHCYVRTANATETQVIDLLEREQIQRALADLPAMQRQTIELTYYAGCTGSEVAARTGVSIGTVKTRLRLGLVKLRALLFTDSATP